MRCLGRALLSVFVMGGALVASPSAGQAQVREPEATIPAGPSLVNEVVAGAADRLARAGFPDGRPAVAALLPPTGGAAPLKVLRPLAGKGAPLVTYRLCAKSATLPVSCSLAHPVAAPITADVTGDLAPDVVADLAPASTRGITFTVKRLGGPVRAQVWAEYELPSVGMVSIGLNGDLSSSERAVYTLDRGQVSVVVRRSSPGASLATFAALNGTLVSLGQSPPPARLTAKAQLSGGKLEVTGSSPTALDGLLVSGSRFTQVTLSQVKGKTAVSLTRPMTVTFAGAGRVRQAELRTYDFRGGALARAVEVSITGMPAAFTVAYARDTLTVTSGAPRAAKARVLYFDRAADATVLRADLAGLPARVRLAHDLAAHRVTHTASSAIGSFAALLQRNGGAIAGPSGAHLTMIKKGDQVGVSGRLHGLSGFDVTYGSAPHALLHLDAGGRPFLGAASIDGTHVARMEISNTPATVEVSLDPAAQHARYQASGVIDRLSAAYTNTRTGQELAATAQGIRDTVSAAWERDGFTWTADHPVTSLNAHAASTLEGRRFTATARVTGVPTRFWARWGAGGYRFRSDTGPLGEAWISVANHDGARTPQGPHLAAHYDATTGDLDASVRVKGLSSVTLTPAATGFAAEVRAARQVLALDADVLLAGGMRVGALGRLGPTPGSFTVTSAGPITYQADAPLDLQARLWVGQDATLKGVAEPPALEGGVSAVAGGGAVRAFVDVTGLPTTVTVDPAARTFTFAGYRPKRRSLRLHLDTGQVKATATLTDLPAAVTRMTIGPFDLTQEGGIAAAYRVEPAATLGSLRVRAQSGGVRGEVAVSPVPAAVSITGVYGRRTSIRVANSTPVKRLSAAVTVPGRGTGQVKLADVPATIAIDADATPDGLRVPTLTYRGSAGTLDGFVGVDGGLIGQPHGASFAVTDLAPDTTVRLNPDLSLDLVSKPVPTKRLEVHAGLKLPAIPAQQILLSKEIPETRGFAGYELSGGFGLGTSEIRDVSITVRDLTLLKVRPGRIPLGLKAPAALGYLSPGFEGAYGRLDLRTSGVDLRTDVRLDAKVTRKVGAAVFSESLRLGQARSLRLHRYDQQMRILTGRQLVKAGKVPVACVSFATMPGPVAARANSVTLRGADGPQLVSLLDPGGQAPGYVVDLLAHFMSPFPGADWKISGIAPGKCR